MKDQGSENVISLQLKELKHNAIERKIEYIKLSILNLKKLFKMYIMCKLDTIPIHIYLF